MIRWTCFRQLSFSLALFFVINTLHSLCLDKCQCESEPAREQNGFIKSQALSTVDRSIFILCDGYIFVLLISLCVFYGINIKKKERICSLLPMLAPDWYLLLTLIIHYRKHYSILCISVRVILRKPFTLPLQKILNKFNCLHPPSEMTLCVLLHN